MKENIFTLYLNHFNHKLLRSNFYLLLCLRINFGSINNNEDRTEPENIPLNSKIKYTIICIYQSYVRPIQNDFPLRISKREI